MLSDLPFTVLDVFAERPLEGNPLCVFHDARGLSGAEMQALARETNLSETTFVLPAEDPEADCRDGVRVRIFTTTEELPFAGHPTLGTASWLRLHHPAFRDAGEITLQLGVGPIQVRFDARFDSALQGGALGLYGSMQQRDAAFGPEYDPAEIAGVLGLAPGDLLPGVRPQNVSTGNPFLVVALRDVATLGRLCIPQAEATRWLRAHGSRWFYCIAPDASEGTWRARMQWESGEDPATGSAAGPAIAWLVHTGQVPSETPLTMWQGVEMGRPSRLTLQAKRVSNGAVAIHVAGRTIPVAAGRFLLPR